MLLSLWNARVLSRLSPSSAVRLKSFPQQSLHTISKMAVIDPNSMPNGIDPLTAGLNAADQGEKPTEKSLRYADVR